MQTLNEAIRETIRQAASFPHGGGECQLYERNDGTYFIEVFAGCNSWIEGDGIKRVYTCRWFDPMQNEDYADWFVHTLNDDPTLKASFIEYLTSEGYDTERPECEYDVFRSWKPDVWDALVDEWREIALNEYWLDDVNAIIDTLEEAA